MNGISLLILEKNMPGLDVRPIVCQGNACAGTAYVTIENVQIPIKNVIGKVNQGFKAIMFNFNHERLGIIITSIRSSRMCYEVAMKYANKRKAFGATLFERGVIRNKLAHMARQIEASYSWLESIVYQLSVMSHQESALKLGGPIALLKAQSTVTFEYCAREASQILGGISYTKGGVGEWVERLYRDVRSMAIPGGSEEIMLDLGIRQIQKLSAAMDAKL
jgi:alkylation response protein AidB-like acyl-CoA dehydrogenase